MFEDPADAPTPLTDAEVRRRLRNEAVQAVRRLSEALDQPDRNPDSTADAQALVARLRAAVEPLRASVEVVSASAVGSGALVAGRATLSGHGTVGIHHSVHVHDQAVVLDSASVTLTPHYATHAHTAGSPEVHSGGGSATVGVTATGSGYAIPTGSGAGTWTFTGTATGSTPPETFQVTAEDVPWILWQMLLRFDDLADPTRPDLTVGQVYDRTIALLGLLVTVLAYLK